MSLRAEVADCLGRSKAIENARTADLYTIGTCFIIRPVVTNRV
jgi:hypothetical protein